MLYSASNPKEYIDQLPADWRRSTLLDLRAIIFEEAPQLEESIHYKMLGYSKNGDFAFHLNAQKSYVSLYVGNASKIDPTGELLIGLNVGKGCIRFTKSKSVKATRIREFIACALELWQRSEGGAC